MIKNVIKDNIFIHTICALLMVSCLIGLYRYFSPSEYKVVLFRYVKAKSRYDENFNEKKDMIEIDRFVFDEDNRILNPAQTVFNEKITLFNEMFCTFEGWSRRKRVLYNKKMKIFYYCDLRVIDPYINSLHSRFVTLIIKENDNKYNKVLLKDDLSRKAWDILNSYTDYSPNGSELLTRNGLIFNTISGQFRNATDYLSSFSYNSSLFLKNEIFILHSDPVNVNFKIVVLEKMRGDILYQHNFSDYCNNTYIQYYGGISAAKSTDEKKVAFIFPKTDGIYISFFSAEDRKIDKGILIRHAPDWAKESKYVFNRYFRFNAGSIPILEWANNPESNLLAEYDTFRIISDNPEKYKEASTINSVLICNTKTNTVTDRIYFKENEEIISLRWSPDDKKLGILVNLDGFGSYNNYNSLLYIYDIKSKKLTKLMDCPDCFDFHFVE